MGKKISSIFLSAILLLSVSGCNVAEYQQVQSAPSLSAITPDVQLFESSDDNEPVEREAPLNYEDYVFGAFREKIVGLGDRDWMDLTTQQMLDDWDYFYQALVDNYPYFGVVERTAGMDMNSCYQQVRNAIPNFTYDSEYLLAVYDFIQQTGNAGHLSLSWPQANDSETQLYKDIKPLMNQATAEYRELAGEDLKESNLTTEILKNGKIAYAKIRSFGWDTMTEDQAILFDFYRQIKDYDHLIFDITGNGGGSMGYYMDLIMAPLLRDTAISFTYVFLKDGQLNQNHLLNRGDTIENWYKLSDAPSTFMDEFLEQTQQYFDADTLQRVTVMFNSFVWPPEAMNTDDFKELDRYQLSTMIFEPGRTVEDEQVESIPFQGKIWVLVDGDVYSSSESFAVTYKQTGFATIVGTQTGGDGIGMDPIIFTLPHSELKIRYAPVYGTTIDGRGSEEFGTTPDIISPTGETPLETCLNAIENAK